MPVYLDDINMFSQTFQDHLRNFKEELKCLTANNLMLKLRKCHFFKSKIDYLGFVSIRTGYICNPIKLRTFPK